eukprot:g5013.t1
MQNIWDEIGDKVPEVDHAIFVLISAGISSPSLRMAADQGVKIEGAGHAEMAVTIVVLGPLLFMSIAEMVGLCYNLLHRGLIKWEIVLLVSTVVGFVVRISFVILFCVVPVDERMFLLKVITKLVALLCLPLALLFGIAAQYDASESIHALGIISMCSHVTSLLGFCFSMLGIQGTLKLPGGRCLLQFILARQGAFRYDELQSEDSFSTVREDEMMEMLQSGRMSINVERRVEAYVASENEKIIQIATAPSWGPMVWTLMSSMMPILLGLTIGTIAPSQAWHLKLEAAVYKGSIQFASCSEPNDLRNIWDELGDQVHEVDNAINVLISAGVSSPSLRRAAELGVKIEGAGHAEVAVAVVVLGPFHFLSLIQIFHFLHTLFHHGQSGFALLTNILTALGTLVRIYFLVMLCISPVDQRMFLLKIITKLVAATYIPLALVVAVMSHYFKERLLIALKIVFLCFHLTLFVTFFFALLGIPGTLKLPGGRCMLHYILARQGTFERYTEMQRQDSITSSEED